MAKKTTTCAADKQRQNSGQFKQGNPYAFKPGQSGNPAGRPPSKKYLSEALRAWLASPNDRDPERTNADQLAAALGKAALAGDIQAIREICDRTEGKPRQAVDLTQQQNTAEERRKWAEGQLAEIMSRLGIDREEAIQWAREKTPTMASFLD